MGVSERAQDCAAALMLDGMPDGAVSADQQVMGTYLHGLFDHPQACQAILQWAGLEARKYLIWPPCVKPASTALPMPASDCGTHCVVYRTKSQVQTHSPRSPKAGQQRLPASVPMQISASLQKHLPAQPANSRMSVKKLVFLC
jgi:hypothetical protein